MNHSGRFIVPWTGTHYTAVVAMSFLSVLYISINYIHLNHILGTFLLECIAAVVITFIPCMLFSALLTCVFIYGLRRNWPLGRLYGIAIVFAGMLFVGFAGLFAKPVVDSFIAFHPQGPDVARPMITLSEVPLLAAAIIAGLMAARVCMRIIKRKYFAMTR